MGDSSPASAQGNMPTNHNGATSQATRKRKRDDYVDCAIHGYHPIDGPPYLLSRNNPTLYPPASYSPQRLGYPSQQSLPRHGSSPYKVQYNNFRQNRPILSTLGPGRTSAVSYTDFALSPLILSVPIQHNRPRTQNNNFPQDPLTAPASHLGQWPQVFHNDFAQNPPTPPAPIPGGTPASFHSNFGPKPLITSVPLQHDRPTIHNNDSSQNPFILPVQAEVNRPTVQNNDYFQNSLIPAVLGGIQGNEIANLVDNNDLPQNLLTVPVLVGRNDFPQNPLVSPLPSGIQGNRSMVFDNNFPQNPPIVPGPVQDNWAYTADKHQFDVPHNDMPFDETVIGAGQDDWLADWPADKQPSPDDDEYVNLFEDNQPGEQHVQPHGLQMNQDSEVAHEFPQGAEIPAPPSPAVEVPDILDAILPQPAAIQNAQPFMCKIPGCDQPTVAQTKRSSKCRDHMENPPPRSREAALAQAVSAGHGFCTGCNGLRPRRAPGRTCWECMCKNSRQRFGVCDGCPASWCPNRVEEA